MKIELKLKVSVKNPDLCYQAIKKEAGVKDRSSIHISKTKGQVCITIAANDLTAYKSAVGWVEKILTIEEKVQGFL